jgi:hypothetical protein
MASLGNMPLVSLLYILVYNVAYYFLYLVLFAVLVVTPIDIIQQGVETRRNYDILALIIVYVVTICVVAFIYAARLYVRRMIVEGLSRSAEIAWEARPRNPLVVFDSKVTTPAAAAGGSGQKEHPCSAGTYAPTQPTTNDGIHVLSLSNGRPFWRNIEHPGWSPPTARDIQPKLQYETVVTELPNLIEARALTLAPRDPHAPLQQQQHQHGQQPLDPRAVALLTRPECAGLREYLTCLTELDVLGPDMQEVVVEFLGRYEAARFSGRPLTAGQFKDLMGLFAEVLRGMKPLAPGFLDDADVGDGGSSFEGISVLDGGGIDGTGESDIDNDAPRETSPSSEGGERDHAAFGGRNNGKGVNLAPDYITRRPSHASTSTTWTTASSSSSVARPSGLRDSNTSPPWESISRGRRKQHYRTAPTTPRSVTKRPTGFIPSGPSGDLASSSNSSFAHTRRPYEVSDEESYDSKAGVLGEGAESGRGDDDGNEGSVIHLGIG